VRECNVTIDPGQNIGVAFWVSGERFKRLTLPVQTCVLTSKASDWDSRCDDVLSSLQNLPQALDCVVYNTWIEFPQFMETSGGRASARRGDLVKLVYMCGRIHQMAHAAWRSEVHMAKVSEWKGQMPKAAVNNRILRVYAEKYGSKSQARRELESVGASPDQSHDWDAIGLGLWAKGVFR